MSASFAPQASNAATGRALWVWSTRAIRQDAGVQSDFFRFLAAPKGVEGHAVTTVFFDGMDMADFENSAKVSQLRQFLAAAHAHHLTVDFLTGDPSWATPEKQSIGTDLLSAVLAFNSSSPAGARYDGFQYDVEPYSLPGWPSAELENGLLALLDKSNALIKESGHKVTLALAIPRWFGNPNLDHLDRKVIDRTDEVDVMDYVTNAASLVNDPADILQYASKTHKAVWIGVETGPLPATPRTTFFGDGNAGME